MHWRKVFNRGTDVSKTRNSQKDLMFPVATCSNHQRLHQFIQSEMLEAVARKGHSLTQQVVYVWKQRGMRRLKNSELDRLELCEE